MNSPSPSPFGLNRPARQRCFHFFQNPSLWPTHPFLPVVRRTTGNEELGILFDARSVDLHGYDCTVFVTNLFEVPPTVSDLLALPRQVYNTWDEVLAAGWNID